MHCMQEPRACLSQDMPGLGAQPELGSQWHFEPDWRDGPVEGIKGARWWGKQVEGVPAAFWREAAAD